MDTTGILAAIAAAQVDYQTVGVGLLGFAAATLVIRWVKGMLMG